jgi:hypothetical protein
VNNTQIDNAFLRLTRRAEKNDPSTLVDTFVDVGPLFTLLSSRDHQVVYGRRGTGKTHALMYLSESIKSQKDIPVYIDMRNIGSTGGIYSDTALPITERATRLLMDALTPIHEAILNYVVNSESSVNISQIGPSLDGFADAITEVRVFGEVTHEEVASSEQTDQSAANLGINFGSTGAALSAKSDMGHNENKMHLERMVKSGTFQHRVHFGAVGKFLRDIMQLLSASRMWVLLDEWSVIPPDLQPFLADLLRRSIFPIQSITVKIGAIEQRSTFHIPGKHGNYIGIELGSDASADINLDDFMVFDNDKNRAIDFFRELVFKHFKSVMDDDVSIPRNVGRFIQNAFTQENTFEEFVRASEGVPRDSINILSLSAQKAINKAISIQHLRAASQTWYQRDKEAAVSSNVDANQLLHWIIDKVIGHRKARAFLLRNSARNELVDALFDSRVLHLLKRNVSARDQPGLRYDVYKLDYGCYVDLLTTVRAPKGFLFEELEDFVLDSAENIEVPQDDYRAIRRAILELDEFQNITASARVRR